MSSPTIKAQIRRLAKTKLAEMDTAASKALMKWLARNVRGAKHIYVVGGAVRNYKIDQPVKDIDMVVDSLSLGKDAAWVAEHIARKIPAMTRVEGPDNLRVTKVHIKGQWIVDGHDLDGETLDIVDARREVYERDPETGEYVGHKPIEVVPTTLEEDVTRREFTFNTLMWRLSELAEGPDKAEIIDLTGCGIRDLENRDMRCPMDADEVFAIDPTRVIRIIKFAFKYGFKLPPDVEAAAKRQAKGLKRIPDKTFSVIRDIALESPHYKKALNVMADLGVTEVLAEMMEENKSFRAAMTNFAEKKGIAYLFDLMDKGIPVGASMKFLNGRQQQRLREITAPMDRDEALEFLSVLKNPGRAYDKKFIPSLAMSHGYKGKEMAKFMPGVIAIGREVLLEEPDLVSDSSSLMEQVRERVGRAESASRLAKTFTINKGQPVWYGKYKNQRGRVKDFGVSDKGDPTITVEQLPAPSAKKPTKKSPKTMSLFKIRPRVEDEHDKATEKSASVPKKYEHINFKPPQGVADAAAKGLELRQKASPSNRGGLTTEEASKEGIGSGVQRAVNLKNRNNVTPKVIKQMRGFLSRSEKSSEISAENKGTPWNDKGYVAWLLWGGDPAKAWVNKVIKQMEAADEKEKQSKQAALVERWGSMLVTADENEPTNPKLWAKVQALAKGEQASMTHGGKTISGPNDGKGFTVFPSAYANGWASKVYGDLGGKWSKKASLTEAWGPTLREARGKAKKDVGHGGLDEWFSGHGGAKGKGEDATWGDWVSISPVTKTLPSGKKVTKGDIVGECGISDDPDWKEITKGGEDPLKCMPRQKAHDMPKAERAEKAEAKHKAEKADSSRGKKPTNTPTFDKKKARLQRIQMKREAAAKLRSSRRGESD